MKTVNKNRMLIFFVIISMFLMIIPTNTVLATSITYPIGFEGTTPGIPYNYTNPVGNTLLITDKSGADNTDFAVSSTTPRYGTRSFKCHTNPNIIGYWNLTYSQTNYLTNFSAYILFTAFDASYSYYMVFYNKSLGLSYEIIYLYQSSTTYLRYQNEVGASVNIQTITGGSYNYLSFSIENDNGDVQYHYRGVTVDGIARRPALINAGYRIDSIYIQGIKTGGSPIYFDDCNFTISTAYTPGGVSGSCIDFSGYPNIGLGFDNLGGYLNYYSPYIEYMVAGSFTGTIIGMELLVSDSQYSWDNDPSNYHLYIDGIYIGVADCISHYDALSYILSWSFSMVIDGSPVIELMHTVPSVYGSYWSLAYGTTGIMGPWPSYAYVKYGPTNMINGIFDQTTTILKPPRYRIYYSSINESGTNPGYTPKINLVGFDTHPVYHVPYTHTMSTIYFDVYVNTSGYYKINVTIGTIDMGASQHFPKSVVKYNDFIGFSPIQEGNYTVSLYHNDIKTYNRTFNVTISPDLDYGIFTTPNPSEPGSAYMVTSYINDSSTYASYVVCGFYKKSDGSNPTIASEKFYIGTLVNHFYSKNVEPLSNYGVNYWRIFGTDDNLFFIPLTALYQHNINSPNPDNIRTSLTDNQGIIDISFNIYGSQSNTVVESAVYRGTGLLQEITGQATFLFPQTEPNVGTFVYYLKHNINGTWTTISQVSVSISKKPVGSTGGLGDIMGMIPSEYRLYIGIGVIIGFALMPILIILSYAQHTTAQVNIPTLPLTIVCIIMSIIGFLLTIIWGLMPWYSVFLLLFILILYLGILMYKGGKSQD